MKGKFFTLLMGIWFGIVLVKGQLVSWQQINDMFHFRSAYMYLVIASAVLVGAISVALIRHFETKTIEGEVIDIRRTFPQRYCLWRDAFWHGLGHHRRLHWPHLRPIGSRNAVGVCDVHWRDGGHVFVCHLAA